MPICFSCGNSCEKLTPSGLCPECAGRGRSSPSMDASMVGRSPTEKALLSKQRDEQIALEKKQADRLRALSERGLDGYYEYKVVDIRDHFVGLLEVEKMSDLLNDLGKDGWRLVTAYSNELGTNAVRVGGIGLNGSVSQNVLIFERFVRL